jgi:hypothetical protein
MPLRKLLTVSRQFWQKTVLKMSTFDDFFSHEKISPITEISISHLLEWQGSWIFEMMKYLNNEIDWKLKKLKIWKNIEKIQNLGIYRAIF